MAIQGGPALPVWITNSPAVQGGPSVPVVLVDAQGNPLTTVTVSPFAQTLLDDTTAADARTTLSAATAVARGRFYDGTNNYYITPGISTAGANSTLTLAPNVIVYTPMLIDTTITIDQLAIEVTTFAALSSTRLGIYNANTNWQPTTLVVDSGEIDTGSNGVKTAAVSTELAPGRYLAAVLSNGANIIRCLRGTGIQAYPTTIGANQLETLTAAQAYGALPTPGTAWTAITAGGTGWKTAVFVRVSVP